MWREMQRLERDTWKKERWEITRVTGSEHVRRVYYLRTLFGERKGMTLVWTQFCSLCWTLLSSLPLWNKISHSSFSHLLLQVEHTLGEILDGFLNSFSILLIVALQFQLYTKLSNCTVVFCLNKIPRFISAFIDVHGWEYSNESYANPTHFYF